MQLALLFVLSSLIYPAKSQNEDKQKCINDIVNWCNNQDYKSALYSTLDTSEMIKDKIVYTDCVVDTSGTRCAEDGYSWYSCSADHKATYNGTELRKDSLNGADYKICDTPPLIVKNKERMFGKAVLEDKQKCINDILDWCSKQNYMNAGNSVVSTSETSDGKTVSLKCITNKSGTTCTKDSQPWYVCSPDHTATYKGRTLQKNSPDAADNEICYTAARVYKYDWQFVVVSSTDKQTCVNDIVDWCGDQIFKNDIHTQTVTDENINGKELHTECTYSAGGGVFCTKNVYDYWYFCQKSHTVLYKYVPLQKNSLNGADDEICYTASRLKIRDRPVGAARQNCINTIVGWCNKQIFKDASFLDWTITAVINNQVEHVQCITNKSGIRCTKSINPWFSCSVDHTATYKGKILLENTLEGTDYDICQINDYIL